MIMEGKCDWSVDQQLEVLKRDYLGMRYTVSFDKYVLSGIAEGLTITETMNFVDWEDACDWGIVGVAYIKIQFGRMQSKLDDRIIARQSLLITAEVVVFVGP